MFDASFYPSPNVFLGALGGVQEPRSLLVGVGGTSRQIPAGYLVETMEINASLLPTSRDRQPHPSRGGEKDWISLYLLPQRDLS